jgi:Tol biopolymer transport system component
MPLAAGTTLGPYAVVTFVGAGGMGEIYKARDTRLDRTVALKILPHSKDSDRGQRFEREARAISQLQHPHICALYDVGNQDGVEYLVMEFLEGQTLAQRIEKGPLPIVELVGTAMQIAEALDHAHRAGICHRDLKPANVMLTKTGVKLLDFGLAGALGTQAIPAAGETATMALTRDGVILGTLPYMSPEQLEGKPGDARSDIFAFGAVLYEMATGKRAFQGSSGASLITQIMSAEPPPMRDTQPVTPPGLEKIVRRCLAKDPEDRWQSARDVGAALELVMGPQAPSGQAINESPRNVWRERIAWGLFAAAVIAAVALAVIHFWIPAAHPSAVTFTIPPPQDAFFNGRSTPAVSPDGRRVAFVAISGGVSQIWIRSLDAMQARSLAGTEGATHELFWSPDGKNVAFDANGKLKRASADGGVVQTICDAPNLRGGSWNQDGIIVFAPSVLTGVYRVPASGGTPAPVTTPDESRGENSHRWPQFLPDGKRFLYFVRAGNPEDWGIYLGWLDPARRSERKLILKTHSNAVFVPPEGTNESGHLLHVRNRTLVAQPFDPDRLQFTGDPVVLAEGISESSPAVAAQFTAASRLLIYGSSANPDELIWFDRAGKRLSAIKSSDSVYSRPELSPDGKRLSVSAIDQRMNRWDIWIIDIARGIPTRFTFGIMPTNNNAVWSPDGKYLAFLETRNLQISLDKKMSDGSRPAETLEVLSGSGPQTACDWSRDGKWILVQKLHDTAELWLLSTEPGAKARPLIQSKSNSACGQFSPDGKWIAFTSDESGRNQIYVQAFPEGPKWQISKDGGVQPRWRGDGKELFYRSADQSVMAVDVRTGAAVEAGTPKALFQAPRNNFDEVVFAINYAVTRDGQKFVLLTAPVGQSPEPLTAVLNWTSLLKK